MNESRTGLVGTGIGPTIFVHSRNAVAEISGLLKGKVKLVFSDYEEEQEKVIEESGSYKLGRVAWARFEHEGDEVSDTLICNIESE